MKNLKTRFLLLVTMMIVSVAVHAEILSGNCGAEGDNLTYTYNTSKGLLKIEGTGAMKNYSVYGPLPPWFSDRTNIIKLELPDGLTHIGSYAFYQFQYLTKISIPSSVTSFGSYAFYDCRNLSAITIPDGVTNIANNAFYNCAKLTDISIPNKVLSIGSDAFSGCYGLTSVSIPNSVIDIGNGAFYNCYGLTSVSIPNSVTFIASDAFRYCEKIKSVKWNSNYTEFPFSSVKSYLSELTIGDDVPIVYYIAGYTNLQKVTLGANVGQLRAEAFKGSGIKDLYITGEEAPYCFDDVFADVSLKEAVLHVPASLVGYCQANEPWQGFGRILDLDGNEPDRPGYKSCAQPVISIVDGMISITCETEGAKIYYDIKRNAHSCGEYSGKIDISSPTSYIITAYACGDGLLQSETATLEVTLEDCDINGDGITDVKDVTDLVNKVLKK